MEATVGKLLLVIGLVIAGAGALMLLGVPVGRLPGDVVLRRGNTTLYVPLATSVLASIVLTLAMLWLRR